MTSEPIPPTEPAQALFPQATRMLEWDRLLDLLSGQARSTLGAARCRSLVLEISLAAAQMRLQETAEMVAFRESSDPFPSISVPDVREALGRAAKGALLEATELRDLSIVLGSAAEVVRYLGLRRNLAPALAATMAPLEALSFLQQDKAAIDRCVDPEGRINESATPELRDLTQHAQVLKRTMRGRLEVILVSRRYAEVLQEQYFAQREGRYVVPVRAEMRSAIPGIVHDVSASGATVFVEPRELVELNNSIKIAELDVDREVRRILKELSVLVARHAAEIRLGLETLAELDSIAAKASFSRLLRGQPILLNDRGRIRLRQARHPLLVLAREQVVANDLLMDEPVRVLVLSGPNTGGKTVTLKIIGLFALMVRAGLQPSCGEGSEMALFPEVYADIGDAQDLTRDLSSFSAHMTQMVRLVDQATAGPTNRVTASPHALVLLDEPVTSTDPAEGAALAEALLVRLSTLGLKVVVTTHYSALKAIAQVRPDFMNASVEFDVRTLSPTYRVLMDMPGGSSAIEIAGRLGMDDTILEAARRLLGEEDRVLERLLSDLQEKQQRLDQETIQATALRAEAERSARVAAELAEALRRSEREDRQRTRKQLTGELLEARAQVQAILDGLKGERTLIKAREAKQRLGDLEQAAQARLIPPDEALPIEQLAAGDRVEIVSLGASGTLLEPPQGKKRVRVLVGEAEMSVALSLLLGQASQGRTGAELPRRDRRSSPAAASSELSLSDTGTVLDLRGKTADDAIDLTIAALDHAALTGAASVRVIHGHGTGRLKSALRAYLQDSPYVGSFRAGERAEGGDGVTIVELK